MRQPLSNPIRRGAVALAATLALGLLAIPGGGCTKRDSVVLAGDGTRLSSEEIDRDPLALLPGGAVGLASLDAQAAFASSLGPSMAAMSSIAVPLGPEANFDPRRDIKRVILGLYSLQGADVAVVIQGTFDPDAIRSAASRGAMTPLGVPLTRLEYAGNDLFIAGGVGFVVVTKGTAIAGNETGIRRTLDRIRDKRIKRELPDWMANVIETPKAAFVGVADLSTDPIVSSSAQQFPFLNGLNVVRVLGNFDPPGLNFAGSLTYPDPEAAQRGAASLQQLSQLTSWTNLLALFGIRPPIQSLQVKTEQRDVQFILAVDSQSAASLLGLATQSIRGRAGGR